MFQQRFRGNADIDKLMTPAPFDDAQSNPNKILIEQGRPTTTQLKLRAQRKKPNSDA